MSYMPNSPWAEVSMDFSGPYPTGEYLMDDYSRFPIVEPINSTAAFTVIQRLDRPFGISESLRH